jgi:ATP-dependent exoDNAse (exonuclease V) beta subunit
LPETDDLGDDAVRISTVHGVKGLEFPIVILGGMANERVAKLPVISVKLNRFEFSLGKLMSHGYSLHSKALENADRTAEQLRILYVAATRARDHLLVSNLAKVPVTGEIKAWSGLYRVAIEATIELELASRFDQYVAAVETPLLTIEPIFSAESSDWLSKLPEIRSKSKAKNLISPSSLGVKADRDSQGAAAVLIDDTKQEPFDYQDGEIAGEDVAKLGNAFHQVMEFAIERRVRQVDPSLAQAIKKSLAEYEVPEQEERLLKMLSGILQHEVMDRIYSADKIMPELAISEVKEEGLLVEGFADLVIQEADFLVVLDYKTNLDLSQDKVEHYAKQLDAYAQIIQRATPYRVIEKLLVHVLPDKVELIAV